MPHLQWVCSALLPLSQLKYVTHSMTLEALVMHVLKALDLMRCLRGRVRTVSS